MDKKIVLERSMDDVRFLRKFYGVQYVMTDSVEEICDSVKEFRAWAERRIIGNNKGGKKRDRDYLDDELKRRAIRCIAYFLMFLFNFEKLEKL